MPSSYGELEIYIVQDDLDLVEISDVDCLPNRNRLGGTFSISRRMLASSEQGQQFLKLWAGSASIQREAVASGSATHRLSFTLQSLLTIRLLESNRHLVERDDFLVNWATGVVTFTPILTEAAEIAYISDAPGDPYQFVFDIVWRRREGKAVVRRLKGCAIYRGTGSTEDTVLSGSFLALEGES